MNLNKLLAVGRSFFGIRSERSPYALRQENLLPKFGPGGGLEAKPEAKIAPVKPGPARSAMDGMRTLFRTSFVPKGGETSPGVRRAVQAELALEGVRVIRNDLRDADLELAPARPRRELAREGASGPAVAPRGGASAGWARIGAKLMEAGPAR